MNRFFIVFSCAALVACQQSREARVAQIKPSIVNTSYDFSRPGEVAKQGKPVWVTPEIVEGWIPAHVNKESGEWVGGHYKATVVKPGHWATLEEAATTGRPYIIAGQTRPVIPEPVRNKSVPTGEMDATAIEQRLAKLENQKQQPPVVNKPSQTSLNNQMAVPSGLPSTPSASPTPPASPKIQMPPKKPEPLGTPPVVPPPQQTPPPVTTSNLSILKPAKKSVVSDTKTSDGPKPVPKTSPKPSPVPVVTPSPVSEKGGTTPVQITPLLKPAAKKAPKASFNTETGEIAISYGESGQTVAVETPKGNVLLKYQDGGKVDVVFNGKTTTVTVGAPGDIITIKPGS